MNGRRYASLVDPVHGNEPLIVNVASSRMVRMHPLTLGGEVLFSIMVGAGIVPLIIAFRVKVPRLRNLSLLLGLFAVIHGLYHLTFGFDQQFLADVVFEPVSLVFLLAFGLYYSKVGIA